MKRILTTLLTLLLCSPYISFSQYYNIPEAERTYGGFYAFGPQKWPVTWKTSSSDTTINGKKCLGHYNQDGILVGDLANYYFTYEDSGVVYWLNEYDQEFSVLIDFNAGVGDSWRTYYNVLDTCGIEVIVDSTDMVNINGQNLKRLYVHYTDGWGPAVTIIERMGFTSSPYPGEMMDFICNGTVADMEHYEGLRCYEDPVFGSHNFNSYACDYSTVGVEEFANSTLVQVFPNPAANELRLSIDKQDVTSFQYRVFDISGKLQLEGISGINDALDISGLKSGTYFISVLANNELRKAMFVKD